MPTETRSLDEFFEAVGKEREEAAKYTSDFGAESFGKQGWVAEEYVHRARSDYTSSRHEEARANILKAANVLILMWQTYNED